MNKPQMSLSDVITELELSYRQALSNHEPYLRISFSGLLNTLIHLYNQKTQLERENALGGSAEPFIWKPIETAPKDGTTILGAIIIRCTRKEISYMFAGAVNYLEGEWCSEYRVSRKSTHNLTHWMTLPKTLEGE